MSPVGDVWAAKFEELWTAYPHYGRRSSKARSRARWMALRPRDPSAFVAVMAGLEASRQSDDWSREGGRFVPACEVWIGKRGWDASNGAEGNHVDPFAAFLSGGSDAS